MKNQKKLKKFNKPLAKVLKKVKALTKRAVGSSAKPSLALKTMASKAKPAAALKSTSLRPAAMAPTKAGKKPQAKVAPAAKNSKVAKAAPAKTPLKAAAVKGAAKHEVNKKTAQVHAPVLPKKMNVEDKTSKGKTSKAVVAAIMTKGKAPESGTTAKPASLKTKGSGKAGGSEGHNERMCRENACENVATTKGYCRLDYIKNWKKIKRKEMILKEGKLNQYIEELVGKYPDKYIDVIRQDLSSEVNFNKVIHDLELDESIDDLDYDGDSIDSLIGSIRKEDEGGFDDEF